MLRIISQFGVDFIRQNQQMMFFQDFSQFIEQLGRIGTSCRVRRIIEEDSLDAASFLFKHLFQTFRSQYKTLRSRIDHDDLCSCKGNEREVQRENRCRHKDLVSRIQESKCAGSQCFCCPDSNYDFGSRIIVDISCAFQIRCDGFPKFNLSG